MAYRIVDPYFITPDLIDQIECPSMMVSHPQHWSLKNGHCVALASDSPRRPLVKQYRYGDELSYGLSTKLVDLIQGWKRSGAGSATAGAGAAAAGSVARKKDNSPAKLATHEPPAKPQAAPKKETYQLKLILLCKERKAYANVPYLIDTPLGPQSGKTNSRGEAKPCKPLKNTGSASLWVPTRFSPDSSQPTKVHLGETYQMVSDGIEYQPKSGNSLKEIELNFQRIELVLKRTRQTANNTVGELTSPQAPGKIWYVLEPGGPDSTKPGKFRISAGTYPIETYQKATSKYDGEFEITRVPGRSAIVMYEYSKSKDMMPGLVPGTSFEADKDNCFKVADSAAAKHEVYSLIKKGAKATISITSAIKETLDLVLERLEQTDNTTLGKLYNKDQTDQYWFTVEESGPNSDVPSKGFRIPAGNYSMRPYTKQKGKFKNCVEVVGNGNRDKLVIMPAKSFKDYDTTATFYLGEPEKPYSPHRTDKNRNHADSGTQLHELKPDPEGKLLASLMAEIRCYKTVKLEIVDKLQDQSTDLKVKTAQMTFDIEGSEYYRNKKGFTRIPHWPEGPSGVTIGRGLDLGYNGKTKKFFTDYGVEDELAGWLAGAAGKKGIDAKAYLDAMPESLKNRSISRKAQKGMFENLFGDYVRRAKATYSERLKLYQRNGEFIGSSGFRGLDDRIQALITDLTYRGDFTVKASDNALYEASKQFVDNIVRMCEQYEFGKLAEYVGKSSSYNHVSNPPPITRLKMREIFNED